MSGYDNGVNGTYRFPAAAVDTAGTKGTIVGPAGMKGRVRDIGYVVTVGVTVAAAAITIGITGDTDKFASNSIPIAAAGSVGNGVTNAEDADGNFVLVDADTAILVTSDGGATAGDADLIVLIDWFA